MASGHYKSYDNLPECCKFCQHLDYEARDEYSPSVYFCNLNIFIPTRTNTCKKHKPKIMAKIGGGE